MYPRRWRDLNIYLLLGVFVLLGFGLMLVWSTTVGKQAQSYAMFINHLVFLGLGMVGLVALMLFDYRNFVKPVALPIYLGMLLLLVLVAVAGRVEEGAQSRIFRFQPSEPAKLLLIIVLAVWWSLRHERPQANSWLTLLGSLLLAGVPLVMVLLQPDFGTAMVMGCIWLAMAWSAGTRAWQLGLLALAALPILFVGWTRILEPYQQGRLVAFTLDEADLHTITDPEVKENVERVYYQVEQSLVAIGHGGLLGQGLNNGIQSQRNFLPVQYTDFIFAVAGEELGFVGAVGLLLFECFVLWQAVSVAVRARDMLGRLLAAGVVGLLLSHTIENVGMNVKLLPMTGIPLPFISYGGSFTVTTLCCIGLLQSVSIRRRGLVF